MNRFLSLLLASLALARVALGCSCLPPPPPLEARAVSDAVFVGKVLSREKISARKERFQTLSFEFEVSEVFKGAVPRTVKVATAGDGGMCGYAFSIGASYLVYAVGKPTNLSTNICMRTKPATGTDAKREMEVLRDRKSDE